MIASDFVQTSFGRLHYRSAGSGDKAFVCIHGLGQSSWYWERVITHLPEGWQGYAIDLLGFGDSDRLPSGYSIDVHASSLAQVMKTLPQKRMVLGANSLGGVVAMRVASGTLVKLDGLFLTATGASVRNEGALQSYRDRLATMEITVDAVRAIVCNFTHQKLSEQHVTIMAQEMAKSQKIALTETLTSSLETSVVGDLPLIKVPTLVLQGAEDKGRTVEDGIVISAGVADGRLIVLPRVGHTPMLEAAEEFQFWFNGALDRWTAH